MNLRIRLISTYTSVIYMVAAHVVKFNRQRKNYEDKKEHKKLVFRHTYNRGDGRARVAPCRVTCIYNNRFRTVNYYTFSLFLSLYFSFINVYVCMYVYVTSTKDVVRLPCDEMPRENCSVGPLR